MPIELVVSLKIAVNNDDEAQKVMDAVYTGMAAEIVRVGALYGVIPIGGAVNGYRPATPESQERKEVKKREAEIQLQDVEVKAKAVVVEPEQPVVRQRQTRLTSFKKLGRS